MKPTITILQTDGPKKVTYYISNFSKRKIEELLLIAYSVHFIDFLLCWRRPKKVQARPSDIIRKATLDLLERSPYSPLAG